MGVSLDSRSTKEGGLLVDANRIAWNRIGLAPVWSWELMSRAEGLMTVRIAVNIVTGLCLCGWKVVEEMQEFLGYVWLNLERVVDFHSLW